MYVTGAAGGGAFSCGRKVSLATNLSRNCVLCMGRNCFMQQVLRFAHCWDTCLDVGGGYVICNLFTGFFSYIEFDRVYNESTTYIQN